VQSEDYESLYGLEATFWWFTGMREITAALVDSVMSPSRNRRVLDAGCGTGGNLSWLKRYSANGERVGLDLVTEALSFCRKSGLKPLVQASVTHLPFVDASFDLVTSFDVLVQLPGENADEDSIREMYRVLRPGGKVFVRVAAYEWMRSGHDEALSTQQRYTLQRLRKKLEQSGFQVRRATYANTGLLPLAIFNRLLLKPLRLTSAGSDVKPLPPHLRWLDKIFKTILTAEARRLARPGARFPAGLSAICVAEKPIE
jgi:ubiquinone/menaquinone biosynthesis C-methylase UbiE